MSTAPAIPVWELTDDGAPLSDDAIQSLASLLIELAEAEQNTEAA